MEKAERIKKGLLHCSVDGCEYDGGSYTSYRIARRYGSGFRFDCSYTGYYCPEHEDVGERDSQILSAL